jgi:hypothetical protein
MNRILRKRTLFSLVAFGAYVAAGACSSSEPSRPSSETPEDAGSIGLELTVGGAQINTVHYDIVGPTTKSGDIDVSAASTVTAFVGGLSAGGGYTITLTAVSTNGAVTCTGQATFSVASNATTAVPVALSCKPTRGWGSIDINGNVTACPNVELTANPLEVTVGSTIQLTGATDLPVDAGAATFQYTSTAGGAFASASAASTTFTCATAGAKTITLAATVAGCTANATATVTCTAPAGTTSSAPYIVPVAPGVQVKALLTVGESVNNKPDGVTPYRLVGLVDGMGAFDNGDGNFTLLSNHEIGATSGAVRAHGARGAFVSKWTIRKSDLRVLNGADLTSQYVTWNTATSSYNAPGSGTTFAFGRFCSADLPPISAFYDAPSSTGFNGRLFMNGEESGNEGRAVAHGLDGTSWQLPRLGKFSWENAVAHPGPGLTTVVAGLDDSTPGQVYFYYGTKTNTGSAVERAGLTNGSLYGLAVTGVALEDAAAGIAAPTPFTLFSLGNVENTTGAALETSSTAGGVTRFQRPEDGSWDPAHPNDFYFVTTASFSTSSRLWRVRFTDAKNPAGGGTIEMLLSGSEGQRMFDNLVVDDTGRFVYLQEDVGGNNRLGKIWRYTIATDSLVEIAQANPVFFDPTAQPSNAATFLTNDEESSGVIDARSLLGPGWLLVNMQAHGAIGDAELVEGGQFLAIYDPAAAQP